MLGYKIDRLQLDEWAPAVPWFTPGAMHSMSGVAPYYGGYQVMGTWGATGNALVLGGPVGESAVRGSFSVPLTLPLASNVAFGAYFGTGHSLVRCTDAAVPLDMSGAVYNYVSPPGAGSGAPVWSFCLFGPARLIATSRENIVQTLLPLGATFVNLITSPEKPQGRFCAAVRGHLVLANIYDPGTLTTSPSRVYWSARNNAAVFTPGTDRCGYLDMLDDGSEVVGMVGYESYFTVLTKNGVYVFTWTGGPYVWERTLVAGSPFGTQHSRSIVRHGADIYYLSAAGPAVIRSGQQCELIAPDTVGAFMTQEVPADDQRDYRIRPQVGVEVIGFSDQWSSIVGWEYPKPDGSGARMVMYNPVSGKWAFHQTSTGWAIGGLTELEPNLPLTRSKFPLDGTRALVNTPGTNSVTQYKFTSTRSEITARVSWIPPTVDKVSLAGVRLWHAGSTVDQVTITVWPFDRPQNPILFQDGKHYPAPQSGVSGHVLGPAETDGWRIGPNLPRSMLGAIIEVTIAAGNDGGDALPYIEGLGSLEVAYTPESGRFA